MVIIIYGNTLQKLIINDSRTTFYKEKFPVEGYPENLKLNGGNLNGCIAFLLHRSVLQRNRLHQHFVSRH